MPNRILKESICTSEDVQAMGWFVEVFFYRLLVNCDDYGRMDARPAILRARLFPLCAEVGEEIIAQAVERLEEIGCVQAYRAGGQPYLCVPKWGEHQRLRNSRQKYPAPGEAGGDAPPSAADGREGPPESQSETESEAQSETEAEGDAGGGGGGAGGGLACAGDADGDGRDEVRAAAAAVGMPWAARDADIAGELCATYGGDWVARAVRRAADGPSRTWRYVRGILKKWKAAGGVDDVLAPRAGPAGDVRRVNAHAYTQRAYAPGELDRLFEEI